MSSIDWKAAQSHPRWDKKSKRIILAKEELEALPVLAITQAEMFAKMSRIYWNGLEWYPKDFPLQPREVGYDEKARYVEYLVGL